MRPNSVHGRHFVLAADGRLRANDKMTVQEAGKGLKDRLPENYGFSASAHLVTSQSAITHQFKFPDAIWHIAFHNKLPNKNTHAMASRLSFSKVWNQTESMPNLRKKDKEYSWILHCIFRVVRAANISSNDESESTLKRQYSLRAQMDFPSCFTPEKYQLHENLI